MKKNKYSLPPTFGERLDLVIRLYGITQRELAERCGITEVTMSRYINNQRVPKASEIIKICRETHISADFLLGLRKDADETVTLLDLSEDDKSK
jgi:transcriptional regulator with XRE-family HTH domain